MSDLKVAGNIVWLKAGGVNFYPAGEEFSVSESCRVEPLVREQDAADRIAALEEKLRVAADTLERVDAALTAMADAGGTPAFGPWGFVTDAAKEARTTLQSIGDEND
jgi:hypothetical protein